ncbi:MAG: hypothetical protein WBD31_00615 [Rubripirellula sp.]
MRNLTLGVLIVTGGALAAIPFRRHNSMSDDTLPPGTATGPSISALDFPPPDSIASTLDSDLPLPGSLPIWHRGGLPKLPPRQVDVPLSFDDLMVPIDQPKPIRQRFAATSENHREKRDQERITSLEMPPLNAIAPAMQEELQRRLDFATPEKFQDIAPKPTTRTAHGSLASAPWLASPPDRLPKPTAPADDRHWIRQP